MSFDFEKIENLSMEDFHIIKIMEEITEIKQEIKIKQNAVQNRMQLLSGLFKKKGGKGFNVHETIENEELKKAIQSFLLKIEAEDKNMLGYEGGNNNAEEDHKE